jgi:DNA-binding response OmpR family regulator
VRILIVEDDDRVARGLATALRRQGYHVRRVSTAGEALAEPPGSLDLVLLDLGLPDADGLEVCRKLRRRDDAVAVIAVTARAEEHHRILGLRSGADDYVVKPFGIGELLARIEAVARRTRAARASADEPAVRQVGVLTMDLTARTATLAGERLTLTRKEFDLLAALAARPGGVCTRDHLLDQVWQESWEAPSRTLDVHVAALRAKLGEVSGGGSVVIETLRGVGYRLRG